MLLCFYGVFVFLWGCLWGLFDLHLRFDFFPFILGLTFILASTLISFRWQIHYILASLLLPPDVLAESMPRRAILALGRRRCPQSYPIPMIKASHTSGAYIIKHAWLVSVVSVYPPKRPMQYSDAVRRLTRHLWRWMCLFSSFITNSIISYCAGVVLAGSFCFPKRLTQNSLRGHLLGFIGIYLESLSNGTCCSSRESRACMSIPSQLLRRLSPRQFRKIRRCRQTCGLKSLWVWVTSSGFTECSLDVDWMFTECSLNVDWMFTECSLNVH
jgi:hypothetical protein